MKHTNNSIVRITPIIIAAFLGAALAGCGGSSGQDIRSKAPDAAAIASPPLSSPSVATTHSESSVVVALLNARPPLPTPSNIANGDVVELQCGRVYQGTPDLKGKINVTVRTAGTCGKAVITPAQGVTGWVQHQGNIYSAPIAIDIAQVSIDGQPQSLAHWPDRTQTGPAPAVPMKPA
jgi:hypothetical protein